MRSLMRDMAGDDLQAAPEETGGTLGILDGMGNAAMSELLQSATSGPFAPAVNLVLTRAFGRPLDGLSVRRGQDAANRDLGAAATTRGGEISLSSHVREDVHDPRSMEILAHETAHALAGPGTEATRLDQPGDPGEERADRTGAALGQFVEGGLRGPIPSLTSALGGRATIHRYQLEGPWNKGDPVHEVLTLETLKAATGGTPKESRGDLLKGVNDDKLPKGTSTSAHNLAPESDIDRSAQEFIRGVVWPDDPKCLLFDDPKGTTNYSSGAAWYEEFDEDEKDDKKALTARSHYGDLQFFHAMASKDGEKAEETKKKMMAWAEFNVSVATGKIGPDTKLDEIEGIQELFKEQKGFTVKDLFGGSAAGGKALSGDDVKQRAAGALLHMIQDSHAQGHCERDPVTGEIKSFHSYGGQDHTKHGAKDAMGPGKNLDEHLKNTPGALKAIEQGAKVLKMMDGKQDTADIMKVLDEEVFKLAPETEDAGAGAAFKK